LVRGLLAQGLRDTAVEDHDMRIAVEGRVYSRAKFVDWPIGRDWGGFLAASGSRRAIGGWRTSPP